MEKNIIEITEGMTLPQGNKLMFFSTTWCPPCRQLAPIVDVVAEKLENNKIPCIVCKINCDNNPKLTREYNIRQVPRLLLQLEKQTIEYQGHRDGESIVQWIKQYIQ